MSQQTSDWNKYWSARLKPPLSRCVLGGVRERVSASSNFSGNHRKPHSRRVGRHILRRQLTRRTALRAYSVD
jgi:hypothetical protein